MELNQKSAAGGGCLIFAGFILGSLIGIYLGQASYGMLIGLGTGIVLALAQWLLSRRS
jgi:hypothetical protein